LAAIALSGLLACGILLANETNIVELALETDSDHDGMSDWEESLTGTNPEDPGSVLVITGVTVDEGNVTFRWQSTSGRVYQVISIDLMTSSTTNVQCLGFVLAADGTGSWHQGFSSFTTTLSDATQFYRIEHIVNEEAGRSTAGLSVFE
jgi:hypothetical protein